MAGSHLTSPASDSDGLVPTVRDLEDLLTPGSSSQEQNLPSFKAVLRPEEKLLVNIHIRRIQVTINKGRQEI